MGAAGGLEEGAVEGAGVHLLDDAVYRITAGNVTRPRLCSCTATYVAATVVSFSMVFAVLVMLVMLWAAAVLAVGIDGATTAMLTTGAAGFGSRRHAYHGNIRQLLPPRHLRKGTHRVIAVGGCARCCSNAAAVRGLWHATGGSGGLGRHSTGGDNQAIAHITSCDVYRACRSLRRHHDW